MSEEATSESPTTRSSRLSATLTCAVLGPLSLYLAFNLLSVNLVTLIHESRVEFVVVENGSPVGKVEIRPSSKRGGVASPLSSKGALQARLVTPDKWADTRTPVLTNARGRATYGTKVQDQGSWILPRLGVTRNLSGRTFRLSRAGHMDAEITLPAYEGQLETFRVELEPQ